MMASDSEPTSSCYIYTPMRRIKQDKLQPFSRALIQARKQMRWSQAELARRAEVGQQTVSKWERGAVRPRGEAAAKLISLFPEATALELRDALGTPRAAESLPVSVSVAALAMTLNLDHLTAEQFQSFSASLFEALYPAAKVNVYGVSGDEQQGIDIEISFPEGYRYTAQCKRVKNFGPKKVTDAVRAHQGAARKKFLLITRPATQQTRDAAAKYVKQGWELWDIEDISRKVRGLPSDKARVLVDAYAPGQRKEFLGIDQPNPFSSPIEFFREFLRRDAIFSHAWAIVGRTSELSEAKAAMDAGAAFVTIVGAGGSGKSRVALEILNRLAQDHPGRTLRVLAPAATVAPVDVERYQNQRGIFLIEDAHDRDDLEEIVSLFRRFAPDATLLVTTRPYALERVESLFARLALDDRNRTIRLRDLNRDDLERLATEILQARNFRSDIAEDIARLADRSPLFTVIASNLVADKRLHPRVLGNEETFRQQVLAHFSDVLTHSLVKDSGEQSNARNLLNLVTVLQPVDLGSSEFAAALERVYKRPAANYDHVRAVLVNASVLVARGGRSRIVPDMLGDYILEQACATAGGRAGSFPERVLSALQPGQLRNVLHNLAKLDWRLTVQEGLTPRASAQIWRAIEQMYRDRELAREGILEAVESAAYFLPAQALQFLDSVGALPSGARVDRVSRILHNAAYHREHVREAAERLWHLGKDMPAQLNSRPDHPIRQLQALASIEPGKPLEYIESILEFGLELLQLPDAGAHVWSPFEFLEPILATEGDTHTLKGNAVQIRHFTVNIDTLGPLRARLLNAAFRFAEHSDLRIALRAIDLIGHQGLRYPIGSFGNAPAKESRVALENEFVGTLGRLETLVRDRQLDPLVVTKVVRAVSWHAGYADDRTRIPAQAVLRAVPKSFEQELTECLVEGWGHHRERNKDDPTRRIEAWRQHQRKVADKFREKYPTVTEALDVLRKRLTVFASAGSAFHGEPHIFIRLLCEMWPEAAQAIARSALTDPNDPLARYTEQALAALLMAGAPQAVEIASALVETANVELKRRVAFAFGRASQGDARPEELTLLERLCGDEDAVTVREALDALYRIGRDNPVLAKRFFSTSNIGTSEEVADQLASHFCSQEPLRKSFTENEVQAFLATLIPLEQMDKHWLQEMLGLLSASHPELVLDFLLARIAQAERDLRTYRYRAIPFHLDLRAQFKFRETGYLRTAMARVLAAARDAQERKSKDSGSLNDLFAAIVGQFDGEVRAYLSEYVTTADAPGMAAVAQVLSEVRGDFVLTELEFIEHILRNASRFGPALKEKAEYALYRAATTGMRSGTRGKPFPEDVAQKQGAEKALEQLRLGSPARKLFTWIRDHAQEQMKRSDLEAELLEDEESES